MLFLIQEVTASLVPRVDVGGPIKCKVEVLESIHCMLGPGFMDNC